MCETVKFTNAKTQLKYGLLRLNGLNYWFDIFLENFTHECTAMLSFCKVRVHLISSQSLNLGGPRGTTDDVATIPSILPCLPLPSGNLQTPFPSIPWCCLPISSAVFLSFLLLSLSLAELSSPCQRLLRQYLSILPYLPLPSGNLQTPFPSIPWCCLPISLLLSSSPYYSFHCPLQNCLRHARGSWDVAIPSELPFLYLG